MRLNPGQQQAVEFVTGPCLVLAGAGSGKTRVITNKIAHLIRGCGYQARHIAAVTFTNKAAREMKERVGQTLGRKEARGLMISTFHTLGLDIIKREYAALGMKSNFSLFDDTDQVALLKELTEGLIEDDKVVLQQLISTISNWKNDLKTPAQAAAGAKGERDRIFAHCYGLYDAHMKACNVLDFDDLILLPTLLLQRNEEVRERWQNKIRYLLVDEYQDTNTAQFELIRLLALKYQNLCVVGDDDQSIYKFRGANIYNILNFEHHFPDATVIKLEQNYRSTQNILDAANAVIANNQGRKEKRLWTDNGAGDKITFEQLDTAAEEADFVARDIARRVRKGEYQYKDCAILYRTNAQSRLFEERFITANIPYKIFGGVNFYARKEVKDLLAYLKTIDNGQDDLAVRRIINIPKRGIGAASINKVALYAQEQEISFYDALCVAEQVPGLGKAAAKIRPFVLFIQSMKAKAKLLSVADLLQEVIETTGYVRELEAEGTDEAEARIENIDELISKAVDYAEGEEAPTLNGFLENVALVADIDSFDENSDYVVLMTLHSAKGLEFPNVYLAGLEDGLFPSYMSITSDNSQAEIEEERRLAYVGITRAKKNLTITSARVRMVRGQTQYGKVSRFVREIPPELLSGKIYEPKTKEEPIEQSTFQKARKAFRTVPSYGGSGYGKEVGEGYGSTFHSSKATKPVYTKVENQRDFGSVGGALSYQVGDRVRHIKFGDGEVMAIVSGGRDYEVTVDFDKAGTKKMFASFAKLKKI